MISLPITASILISVSSNIDNIGVGIAYGMRGVRIPLLSNILIAMVTGAGTLLSMIAGHSIGRFVGSEYADLVSGLLLISLGVLSFFQKNGDFYNGKFVGRAIGVFRKTVNVAEDPLLVDSESGHIHILELVFLSIALSINNIANGIAAGIAGLSVYVTTIFVFTLSVTTIWMGFGMGIQFREFWISKNSAKISGVILFCMGLYEILS